MDTKWQSSHMNGDVILISLKGNRISGNGCVEIREILLDLRFKVYYIKAIDLYNSISILFFFEDEKEEKKMNLKKKIEKEEFQNLVIQTKKKEKIKKEQVNIRWIRSIVILAFIISFCLSFVSEVAIPNLSLLLGILLTLIFVFVGVFFDIIGVAVTSANEKVFHSMNSRKVRGANIAVKFKKNADKVSSFCCDVIGDICGIVSGAAASTIATILVAKFHFDVLFTGLIVAAIVASLTIGGKAIGKSFAINKSDIILYEFARVVSFFYKG